MAKCSKCGRERDHGMYSLVSDMCDECYEREKYPDINYEKIYKSEPLDFSNNNVFFSLVDTELKIYDKIKREGKSLNKLFASVFFESDTKNNIKEVIESGELKYSYYFTNSRFDLVPNFQDRYKKYKWIICE